MAAATNFASVTKRGGFQNAIDLVQGAHHSDGETPRTLLELKLCEVSGAIRGKEKWWIEVHDDDIVGKWRLEAGEVNAELFEYALKECRWYASKFPGPVRPAAVDGVYSCMSRDGRLVEQLLAGIQHIRDLERRDVHPGSDGLVVNHVHPSMYAFEMGVTPVIGGADVHKMPDWKHFVLDLTAKAEGKPARFRYGQAMCSAKWLVWLPAEFFVRNGKCEINSYINSLHPVRHAKMYDTISDAFMVCLPLFEQVLSELGTPKEPKERLRRIEGGMRYIEDTEWDSELDDDGDDFGEGAYWERISMHKAEVPKEFVSPPLNTPYNLREKPLQVIVKMASIELTPQKPKYEGGSWHMDGMRNERIVATCCMYLESINCTESMLEFRVAVAEPQDSMQGDYRGCRVIYGLEDGQPLVQPCGACRTLPGRSLCWPNTLQHRLRPFELLNKTKPGRRTILCFFLVDPTLRIRSTATVPPQCKEWLDDAMVQLLPSKFPSEVAAHIVKHLHGLSYEDACVRRESLMNERRELLHSDMYYDGVFYERPCSVW